MSGKSVRQRELDRAQGVPNAHAFWSRVTREEEGCWEWAGQRSSKNYGRLKFCGRDLRAHRVAWELANGRPIPDGLVVMHSCDNPPCCNPDHLSVGTHADNIRDRDAKGRWVPPRVEVHWQRRKTECKHGHPFTDDNTILNRRGKRHCRTCRDISGRARDRSRAGRGGGVK